MKKVLYTSALFLVSLMGWAQEGESEGELRDAEFVIEKDREIILEKETKLYEFIKWKPETQKYEPVNPGEFEVFEYDLAEEPQPFQYAKTEVQKKESDYYQYIKAGLGNYWSPVIDLSLVKPGNPNQTVGLNYKHLSFNSGPVDKKNSASSFNEVSVYGTKVWEKVKTNARFAYRSDVNYFYGYPEGTVVDREDIKKSNNFLNARVSLEDNNLKDNWEYTVLVGYRGFFDNYDNSENTLDLQGEFVFKDDIHLDVIYNVSNFNNTFPQNRSHFLGRPYYSFEFQDLKVDAGLSVSLQSDNVPDMNNVKVFPYLAASYELSPEYELFANLDGGYDFNTMYSLSEKVPYLNPANIPVNTENMADIEVGIRGDVLEKWYAQVSMEMKNMRYMPLYMNSPVDQSLIDIDYDPEIQRLFNIGLSTAYYLDGNNNFELTLDFNSYTGGLYDQAYSYPSTELYLKGEHELFEKLTFQWQYALLHGIKIYDAVNDQELKLKAINKLDLSLHYQVAERLGAFVSSENTIGQNYSRYFNYPQRGIQIKAGVTYRF
ncbi:hypothetical protein [Reichenbachiella ulvae]|uniref:TonB dependent receptor n=1 Tax=Reichenbachiella ulvae TaxID=2980104 RepID=A0ABT3CRQ5_9BACT|nr:hypothetical protein [Reichenbachiella ulvae]MCV9386169.1 hypothetical protein [Reichenbachiella ulvae]